MSLAACLVALAAAPGASARAPTRLDARLTACTTGEAAADRAATFVAGMPAIPGTRRLSMRFDLLARIPPSRSWVPVRVDTWGRWERSEPGRPGFIYTKRVQGLAAPAAYRAVVRFRWLARGGYVVRSARRLTRACRQPDLRPDLRAGELTAQAGAQPGTATYHLVVENGGLGAAGAFDVVLTVDGTPQPAVRLGPLAAGASTVLSMPAPRCTPGTTVRVVLDANAEIDESGERDDVVDRPCPLGV